jgi:hypothetical protein
MGKTITLRDVKTNEALYPDVLVTNTYDSEGNNLVSILSKKADLVGGVIPLSQLPEIIVNGDGLVKEVVVNNVTSTLDPTTKTASVTITAKNIEVSGDYKIVAPESAPTGYTPIIANSTIEGAFETVESNVIALKQEVNNLVSVLGVEEEEYKPGSVIYISEAKTLKEAVDILDTSLNQEITNTKNYVDSLFEWGKYN